MKTLVLVDNNTIKIGKNVTIDPPTLDNLEPTIITPWSCQEKCGLVVVCNDTLFLFSLRPEFKKIGTIQLEESCVQVRMFGLYLTVLLSSGKLMTYKLSLSPYRWCIELELNNIHLLSNDAMYALTCDGRIVSSLFSHNEASHPEDQYDVKSVVQFSAVHSRPGVHEFVMCTDSSICYYSSLERTYDKDRRRLVLDWQRPLTNVLTLGMDLGRRLITTSGVVMEYSLLHGLVEVTNLHTTLTGCAFLLQGTRFVNLVVDQHDWLYLNTRDCHSKWKQVSGASKTNFNPMTCTKK